MEIAGLQNISSFTLLKSPISVEQLIGSAKKRGYKAIALTDINFTYGLIDFYKIAKSEGIKPLLGMQLRINGLINENQNFDLIVIAKNNVGYQNIMRLSSAVNLITENGKKEIDVTLNKLQKYLGNLHIITTANQHSELRDLFYHNFDLMPDYIRKLAKILPQSSNLYLGVFADKSESNYINSVKSLSEQFNLKLVAVEDVQYIDPHDVFLQEVLQSIDDNQSIRDGYELTLKHVGNHYLKTKDKLCESYNSLGILEALRNTKQVFDDSNVEIKFIMPQLPKFIQHKFDTSYEFLHHLAMTGLQAKFNKHDIPAKYLNRLKYELKIIDEMGFNDYFLIVWDVINYCHSIGILTGPGRGSAAGSLVAYCLNITRVDPLRYDLLFERFLNPARHQMPDIDLDIPDNRRNEVVLYMFHKYGMDHVAQILSFSTFAAKQVLHDVGNAFSFNKITINSWQKAIPKSKSKITLSDAYKLSKDFRMLVNATESNKLFFEVAKKIEGLPRHYSIHAAGLVISDMSIAKTVGLQNGSLGIPVTQQTKKYVEALGLLKIDFLGLCNLTILDNAFNEVKMSGIKLDMDKIPLDDPATIKLFQKGKTDDIFQFESQGIRNALKKMQPNSFDDIVAMNALYRPGPIKNIDSYIRRKNKEEKVVYPDPILINLLKPTYGIIIYQEQVMKTAQIYAGFSLGEADLLRRAISSKDSMEMKKIGVDFVNRAVQQGHSASAASSIFEYILKFSNYGFNKSHSVAYSKMSYLLAYLKVHYPKQFYVALLNSNIYDKQKVTKYIMDLKMDNIKITLPDINYSKRNFYISDKGEIVTGLDSIIGLRMDFVEQIMNLQRPIKSLTDFLWKIDTKYLSPDMIGNLIKSGAFDKLHKNRSALLASYEDLLICIKMSGGNNVLFQALEPKELDIKMPSNAQKEEWETSVLGFSPQIDPILAAQIYAKKYGFKPFSDFTFYDEGVSVGKMMDIKVITTKNNKKMAFAKFNDLHETVDFVIFPAVYESIKSILSVGKVYLLKIETQTDKFNANKFKFILLSVKQIDLK